MKRERTIKIAILTVVFIIAIIVFSYCTNRGSADMTADMSVPTIPVLSFEIAGKEVNMLVGHKREMNFESVRDSITVYDDNKTLAVKIGLTEETVDTLKYEVYTADGKKQLHEDSVEKVEKSAKLKIKDVLLKDQEGVLKITLTLDNNSYYYYTRIVKDNNYYIKECLEYVEELHNNMLKNENRDDIKTVIETNEQGDNTTYAHVDIHSDLTHVTWGGLKPEQLSKPTIEIKETKKAYTAIQLNYRVKCAGDNNEEEIFQVKEFFKVTRGTKRMYLMGYNRTMQEEFHTSNVVLSAKGILLGISDETLSYKVNQEGTIVAFIQANELWSYNKKEDAFALVFSFAEAEKEDIRNLTDHHSIRILSMEDNGNMTFSVNGYMNRGMHEGESGIAIYYYNMERNSVKEEAFIPSQDSVAVIEKELSDLAFYNKEQDILYVMSKGTLLKIDSENGKQEVLIEELSKEKYVASEDGHLLAYQTEKEKGVVTEIWDFAKDSKTEIQASEGELIIPLGFIGDDFVYGLSKTENGGVDTAGASVQAMYRLEIRNADNKVVKSYEKEGTYILKAIIEGNMVTLRQGTKNGEKYTEVSEDYITNNESSGSEQIELQSYWTDLKETQYRLTFVEGIQDKNAKTLKPKQTLQELATVIDIERKEKTPYFYVYGHGEQAGVFEEAGEAIDLATQLSGVVISPQQNYVWEDGNRVAWYRNFDVDRFTPNAGENTLAACIRKVLAYEGKKTDVLAELGEKTPEQILSEQIGTEAVRFRGCSSADMRYLIDKGVPVIAMKNATEAILLIGFDAETITYVEPSSGSIFMSAFGKIDEMMTGSAHTFIGYVR